MHLLTRPQVLSRNLPDSLAMDPKMNALLCCTTNAARLVYMLRYWNVLIVRVFSGLASREHLICTERKCVFARLASQSLSKWIYFAVQILQHAESRGCGFCYWPEFWPLDSLTDPDSTQKKKPLDPSSQHQTTRKASPISNLFLARDCDLYSKKSEQPKLKDNCSLERLVSDLF